ncbi:glycerate kinase [Alginatibacterium sediminis]|uniref:Glycerate kinase n=1 Tax=Alginatibacterium sediminis TaxID=2164068 RepID=A0A420E6U5_9ALTE|nr:glycerate kinase [Alginatibacterium sediminis]RKF13755.1 glycerate kinase [Alginatibacterium sediminis]
MKIVIAPDSFKESLSAAAVASAIESGFRQIFPNASYYLLPLADGGEGTVEVLLEGLQGQAMYNWVQGPQGKPVHAMWALLDDGQTALIEIAAASGLDLIPKQERMATTASSFGTGELIQSALDHGVKRILLGLGGSATTDGGAGILQALGASLKDAQGQEIEPGGLALNQLASIDVSNLNQRCKDVEFIIACDVANPLCGEEGAAFVFGPQKGATPEQVSALDMGLENFANLAHQVLGCHHGSTKGFGAAGGAALGLALAFTVELKSGIDMVLDSLDADALLQDADLVITGEGQMDNQTLQGKTPYGIAKRAQNLGIPVIGIAGSLGTEVDDLYSKIDCVFGTVRSPQQLDQVLSEAHSNLQRTARNVAATLLMGSTLNLQ